MNFDKEGSKFEIKNVCVCVWREGGVGGNVEHVVKINISKSKNSNLSSLLSEF